MNIFFLDENPFKAAEMLCDKHLSKMQLEQSQLLCTAVHKLSLAKVYEASGKKLYKKTHANHPSAVWTRASLGNLMWLRDYCIGMDCEWQTRNHLEHASHKVSCDAVNFLILSSGLTESEQLLTEVPLCMPDEIRPCSHLPLSQAVEYYRKYYLLHKAYMAKWPAGRHPYWWVAKEVML